MKNFNDIKPAKDVQRVTIESDMMKNSTRLRSANQSSRAKSAQNPFFAAGTAGASGAAKLLAESRQKQTTAPEKDVAAILREKNQKRDRQYEDLFANKYAGMSYAEMYKDIEAMRSKRNTTPSATLDVEIEAAEKYAKAHKYDSLTTEELKAELDKANVTADAGNPSLLESVFGIIGSGNKNDKNQWLIDAKNEVEQAYINRLASEAESADELKAKLDGYIPSYEMLADPRNLTDPDSAFNSDKKLLEQAYKTRLVNDANAANGGEARLAELKSEIAELKKQPDSDALVKAKQAEYDALYHGVHGDADLGQYLYDILDTGAAGFNKSLSATADATLGNLLDAVGWEDNLFRRWNRWHDEQLNAAQGRLDQSTAAMGEGAGWGFGATLGKGTVQALPDAIITLLTFGASGPAQVAKLGAPTTGLLNTVRESLQGLAKNPQYWTSMIQEYGTSYEQAKSEGASETAALTTATLSSLLNSAVEIGGGLQTIPDELLNNRGNKKAIRTWVEGMLDEGKEEVVQGVISNLTSAVVYDQDREIFSMEDESAIINPSRMAKEFAMGAAVGGILGGGQIGVASTMNRLSGADTNLDTSGRFGDVVALDSKGNSVQVAKYNPIQSVEDGRVVLNTTAGAASTKDITFTNSFLPQLYEYAANNYGVTGGNMYVRGYENAKQHNADVNIDTYTGVFNEVVSQVQSGKSEDTIRKNMAPQIETVGEPAFLYAVTGAESIASARSTKVNTGIDAAETAKTAVQDAQTVSKSDSSSDVSAPHVANMVDDVTVSSTTAQTDSAIIANANRYDGETAQAYSTAYQAAKEVSPNLDADTYTGMFNRISDIAKSGFSMHRAKQVLSAHLEMMGDTAFETAYNAGVNQRNNSRSPVKKVGNAQYQIRQIADGADVTVAKKVSRKISKATGIQFIVAEAIHDADGKTVRGCIEYDADGKPIITLSMESPNIVSTAFHELTHWLRDMAPNEYQRYADYVIGWIEKRDGTTKDALIEDYLDRYGLDGFDSDIDKAIEEIVCDASEAMLNDKDAVFDFANTNRGTAQKIADFFTDLFRTIQNYIGTHGKASNIGAQLSKNAELARDMRDLWVQAFNAAVENSQNGATKNTAQTDGRVRYSVEEDPVFSRYCEMIESIAASDDSSKKGQYIEILSQTPDILVEKGDARNLPVAIQFDSAYLETRHDGNLPGNYHNLGATRMKQLPELLEDPEYIIRLKNGRLNVIVNMETKKGKQSLVSIELDQAKQVNGKFNRYNLILTVFGTKSGYLEKIISNPDNEIKYKKETDSQGTDRLHTWSDGINASVSNISIPNPDEIVKQNSEEASDTRRSISDAESNVDLSALEDSDIDSFALERFGRTFKWAETGYLLKNGKRLDFSGKNDGAPGGYRTVDHRDILDAYGEDYYSFSGTEAMIDYMRRGNIRIMPESNGINLSVAPTKAQEDALENFISTVARGEVILDIDDLQGNTLHSIEYSRGTRASKVLNDIRRWFSDGVAPEVSPLAQFRYSLADEGSNVDLSTLLEDNDRLRKANGALREQFVLTHGKKPNQKAVERLCRDILKKYTSSYDLDSLTSNFTRLFEFMATEKPNEGSEAYDAAMELATMMAKSVLQESNALNTDLYDQYAELRQYLRTTGISISEEVKNEMAYVYGSRREFHNAMFGRVKIINDGIPLDSVWVEMSAMYPELFDAETGIYEQPERLIQVLDMLQPYYENPYGANMDEYAAMLAGDIFEAYFDTPEMKTFADRKAAEKASALQKAKDAYKQRMADYRTSVKDKHDKAFRDLKDHYEERNKKLLDRKNEQLLRQKAKYQDMIERGNKRRKDSERMRQLKRNVQRKAMRLSRMLLSPTDQKHIPDGLSGAINEMLQMLDFGRNRMNRDGELTKAAMIFSNLKTQYEKLQKTEDGRDDTFYDDDIVATLAELYEIAGKTAIPDMSIPQLESVEQIVDYFNHLVNNSNQMLSMERKETLDELGARTLEEMKNHRKQRDFAYAIENGSLRFPKSVSEMLSKGLLKPHYFFEQVGGTMQELYENMRNGENTAAMKAQEAKQYLREARDKHGYKNWRKDFNKRAFKLSSGETIYLTVGEIMNLYLLNKREQGRLHIYQGGVTISAESFNKDKTVRKAKDKRSNTARSFTLTTNDVHEIVGALTDDQIAYADTLGRFLSGNCAEWGNEISLKLYGYKKFTDPNYIPITSDSNYLYSKSVPTDDTRIRSSGMTKATLPNASNPIALANLDDVWSRHVEQMIMYNAFCLPIEDFNRVYNYRSRVNGVAKDSVKALVKRTMGGKATSYIQNILIDVNGGLRTDEGDGVGQWLMSRSKMTAVAASMSVVVQQPTSIVRAADVIDTQYLLKTTLRGRGEKTWDECKKYCGAAIVKEMGYFDIGMGRSLIDWISAEDYNSIGEKVAGFFTDNDYRDEGFMYCAALADQITWCHIWNAVKAETADLHPELTKGSETYFQKCAERFQEVIDRTQVYDSVFQRCEMMRKGGIARMSTAFMSEPITSYNMLYSATFSPEAVGKAKRAKKIGRTTGAVVASWALASAFKSLVTAARDDEDKPYWKRWLDRFLTDFAQQPIGIVPYAEDVVSIISSLITGNQPFSSNALQTRLLTDTAAAVAKLDDDTSVWDKGATLAGAIGNWLGIPASNIVRECKAILNVGQETIANLTGTAVYDTGYEEMFSKMEQGEFKEAKDLIDQKVTYLMRAKGKTEKEAKSAVKSKFTTQYKAAYIDAVLDGDFESKKNIRNALYQSKLYEDLEDLDKHLNRWLANYFKEAYVKADASSRIDIRKQIIKSGVYKTDEVDDKLKGWLENAEE